MDFRSSLIEFRSRTIGKLAASIKAIYESGINDAITSDSIDNKPIIQLNDNIFLVGFNSTLTSTLNATQTELGNTQTN